MSEITESPLDAFEAWADGELERAKRRRYYHSRRPGREPSHRGYENRRLIHDMSMIGYWISNYRAMKSLGKDQL